MMRQPISGGLKPNADRETKKELPLREAPLSRANRLSDC